MKIRGITVTGNSRQQAEEAYRAVATGKSVRGYADVNSEFMILCSGDAEITPFNPLTGDADMVEAGADIVAKIEFQSESSDVVQQSNYVVCSSGCGSHVISDDTETRFCPACAEALPDDDCPDCDEQSQNQAHASANVEFKTDKQQIVAVGSTYEEAVDAFRTLACNGAASTNVCGNIAVASNMKDEDFKFSPFLGNEKDGVQQVAMAAVASGADDEEVPAHHFQCMHSDCGLHVLASSDDPVFCPSCSSGLLEPQNEEQESNSSDDDDLDDVNDDEEEEEENDDTSDDDSSDDDEEEEEENEDEDDLEDEDDDEESLSAATVRTKVETVKVERPMLVCVAGSEPDASKLHVAYAGMVNGHKTAVAFYDGVPVATATAASAKEFADMLDNPRFGTAIASAAAEIGVAPALAQMGFVDIKPQIEVDQMAQQQVAEQVAAQTEEIRAQAATEKADLASRFTAALATASQGMNTGFFKDVSNPTLNALASALTSIGVQDAEKLVVKVFNDHHDTFVKNLVAKASQIMTYDLAVQNDLAEAVAGTAPAKELLPLGKPAALVQPQQMQQTVQQEQQESVSSGDSFSSKLDIALFSLGRSGR